MCSLLQIGHKYVERRLLVAEACGGLAPYLPVNNKLGILPTWQPKLRVYFTRRHLPIVTTSSLTRNVYFNSLKIDNAQF